MVASSLKDDESGVLRTEGVDSGLLKASAVFGPNSSGKSYIVKAVQSLKIVVGSARPEGLMPEYIPFRLSKDCLNAPVELSIRVLRDGTVYEYSISYRLDGIVSESLRRKVGRKYEPVFVRGTGKEMMDPVVKERLTSTTAYLNIAPGFNYPVCNAVLQEIMGIMIVYQSMDLFVQESYRYAMRDPEMKEMMRSGLDAADLVTGFVGEERTIPGRRVKVSEGIETEIRPHTYAEIQLIHSFKDADVDQKMLSFPLDIESSGTVEMFSLMGPVAKALKEGRTLIIDEFGVNLHPLLNRWIVGLFNYTSNDNGAQLIVNTHDLCLMDIEEVFRRDQIWLTNKCRDTGACDLYSLADIKGVRKTTDVRKEYLLGRYDALPMIVGVRVL